MGAEAKCTARFQGSSGRGIARLETAVLQFRSPDLRLQIPLADVTRIAEQDGALSVTFRGGRAEFEFAVAGAARKWAGKISNPPSLHEKLGIKRDWRVSAIGHLDDAFVRDLEREVAFLSTGRVVRQSDAIFIGMTRAAELSRLTRLKKSLKPSGAIWVIRPKGRPEISERAVMTAGRAAGLVDVKVVSFSPTHTAEKFVIPLARR